MLREASDWRLLRVVRLVGKGRFRPASDIRKRESDVRTRVVGATRVCLLSDGCRDNQSFVYERNSFRCADSISVAVISTASFTLKVRFMRARSRRNEGGPEPL